MHVLLGVVCVLLASWRIHMWRKMCSSDDEHVQRCAIGRHGASLSPCSLPARPALPGRCWYMLCTTCCARVPPADGPERFHVALPTMQCRVRSMLRKDEAPSARWRTTVTSRLGALGLHFRRSLGERPASASPGALSRGGSGSAAPGPVPGQLELQAQPAQEQQQEQQQVQQQVQQQQEEEQAGARFMAVVRAAAAFKAAGSPSLHGGEPAANGSSNAETPASTEAGPRRSGAAEAGRSAFPAAAGADTAADAAAVAAEAGEACGPPLPLPPPLPAAASSSALSGEGSKPSSGQVDVLDPVASEQLEDAVLPEVVTTAGAQQAQRTQLAAKSKFMRRCVRACTPCAVRRVPAAACGLRGSRLAGSLAPARGGRSVPALQGHQGCAAARPSPAGRAR